LQANIDEKQICFWRWGQKIIMADNDNLQKPAVNGGGSPRAGTILNLLIGLWLVASPSVYSTTFVSAAKRNDLYIGILVLLFSVIGIISVSETWSRWINTILGLWLLISPFVLGFTSNGTAMWSNIILGILIVIFSLWSAGAVSTRRRMTPQYR
jgi:hypothetical protein